jgi:outer membrane protein assembly factor BamB
MSRWCRDPFALLMVACLPGATTLACTGEDDPEPPASQDSGADEDGMADAGPREPEEPPEEPAADATGIATWSIGALGTSIGRSGIAAGQVGAAMEIYVGGAVDPLEGNVVWSALRYSAASGSLEPVYVSDLLSSGILRVALARAGSRSDIVVALSNGTVRRYDQRTKRLRTVAEDPCATRGGLYVLITADLNGDGFDETVSNCGNGMLFAYGSQYPRWQRDVSAAGTYDLTAGQMDGDPALEIATANGHVVDSATHAVDWFLEGGFGRLVRAADIDGDGRDEIVGADFSGTVSAYDVELQDLKWSTRVDDEVEALQMGDIDDDGLQEVVIGDGAFGDVHAFDGRTGQEEGVMSADFGPTDIAVVDLDMDGRRELLWGAGSTTTGPDHLYVADWPARTIITQTDHLDGPFVGPEVGDVDGDGRDELVAVTFGSDSGFDGGRIVVIDGEQLTVRAISPGVGGSAGGSSSATGAHDVVLRDLDGDGRREILVATDDFHEGLIQAYSFSAANQFSLAWTNQVQPAGEFTSVEVADVDGDGEVEVLGGGSVEDDPGAGVFIYAYDAVTGAQKWRRQLPAATAPVTHLVVANTDGDDAVEVAGLAAGGNVYVLDGATRAVEAVIEAEGTALTSRATKTGVDLLLGTASGRMSVHQFDGTSYVEIGGADLGPAALDGLTVLADGGLWVGSGGILRRFDRVLGGRETFASRDYGPGTGGRVAVLPGTALFFTTGAYGIHGFPPPRAP